MDLPSLFPLASAYLIGLGISGGLLVAGALGFAFTGMRKEDFPSSTALRAITAVMAVLVVSTATLAVLTARDEQKVRREENEEASREAEATAEENVEAEGSEVEGEAAGGPQSNGGTEAGGAEGTQQAAVKGDPAAGGVVFEAQGCGSCHTLAAAGTSGTIGPSLDDEIPTMDAAEILTSITEPGAEVEEGFPDGVMPANYADLLDEQQLADLVAYLQDSTSQ